MTAGHVLAVGLTALVLAVPVVVTATIMRRTKRTAPPKSDPEIPAGFAPLIGVTLYVEPEQLNVFTSSHGLVLHMITPADQGAFLAAHDPLYCDSPPVHCWHRSPTLPALGAWGDWLIELDAVRTTCRAVGELTVADMRAIDAFIEYGHTQRAHQNGAHR